MGVPLSELVEAGVVVVGGTEELAQGSNNILYYSYERRETTAMLLNSDILDTKDVLADMLAHKNAADFARTCSLQSSRKALRYVRR